jgi:hypothetical protein
MFHLRVPPQVPLSFRLERTLITVEPLHTLIIRMLDQFVLRQLVGPSRFVRALVAPHPVYVLMGSPVPLQGASALRPELALTTMKPLDVVVVLRLQMARQRPLDFRFEGTMLTLVPFHLFVRRVFHRDVLRQLEFSLGFERAMVTFVPLDVSLVGVFRHGVLLQGGLPSGGV